MEVKCPNCASRFNLPDAVAKPGVKLRCSVCKNIFRLEGGPKNSPGDFDLDGLTFGDEKKSKGLKRKLLPVLAVLLLAVGGFAGWQFFKGDASKEQPLDAQTLAQKVELLTMRNVRQYYVNNEKVGSIFVIEGKVVNEFPVPKELIEVEGAIYGPDKGTLASKTLLAGTALSHFQLQVLGEKELETFLSNKIEILTNNTNVLPGAEVPFMVLFYNPPANVAEFGVKIVDVKDVEAKP